MRSEDPPLGVLKYLFFISFYVLVLLLFSVEFQTYPTANIE